MINFNFECKESAALVFMVYTNGMYKKLLEATSMNWVYMYVGLNKYSRKIELLTLLIIWQTKYSIFLITYILYDCL